MFIVGKKYLKGIMRIELIDNFFFFIFIEISGLDMCVVSKDN